MSVLHNIDILLTRCGAISASVGGTLARTAEDNRDSMLAIELPLFAAFNRLAQKIQGGLIDLTSARFLRRYRRAHHYNQNIAAMLSLILETRDIVSGPDEAIKFMVRMALDVEKLISDVRSLLSELYQLMLQYQPAQGVESWPTVRMGGIEVIAGPGLRSFAPEVQAS